MSEEVLYYLACTPETIGIARQLRHILHYNTGRIFFTVLPAPEEPSDQRHQRQEIHRPEKGAARRDTHERIRHGHARPGRGQRADAPFRILEKHPVPAPVSPARDQAEVLPEQRMEGVGDLECLQSRIATTCNRKLSPRRGP